MAFRIEVYNFNRGVTNTFAFATLKETVKFSSDIKDEVYQSKNKHIRTEQPDIPRVLERYVIYTSQEDIERVTVYAV